jgi:3-oxoacyl-[acyl-carrier protein] reductase
MFELHGKRALVCGSTQGIGKSCAQTLAQQGAALTLLARNETALAGTARGIAQLTGAAVDHLCADFSDPDALRARVEQRVQRDGGFDILVNNTGGPPSGPLFDAPGEAFLKAITMHVLCNQALAQALVPGMKLRGWGRIINVISTSVREPIPGLGVSNTTRAAVAGWAKTLSRELAPLGITVNNVLPGYTDTARLRSLFEKKAEREGSSADQVAEQSRQAVPLGRFARPEEIAAAVAFLASPEASYVSGVSLAVDGGRMASI